MNPSKRSPRAKSNLSCPSPAFSSRAYLTVFGKWSAGSILNRSTALGSVEDPSVGVLLGLPSQRRLETVGGDVEERGVDRPGSALRRHSSIAATNQ